MWNGPLILPALKGKILCAFLFAKMVDKQGTHRIFKCYANKKNSIAHNAYK